MRISDWSSDVGSSDLGLAAAVAGLTLAAPRLARADADTLAQIKQRGSLRVGVTQAPPWYSKDPKTGEWSSGVGVSLGKAMARALGVKFEPVEVTWGTAIAALQSNKIDIMYMMDAAPERAQAVDFPDRSEEHTSELQSLMRISYAVFCLKK